MDGQYFALGRNLCLHLPVPQYRAVSQVVTSPPGPWTVSRRVRLRQPPQHLPLLRRRPKQSFPHLLKRLR